jgi:hypothetical protein
VILGQDQPVTARETKRSYSFEAELSVAYGTESSFRYYEGRPVATKHSHLPRK